MNPAVRRSRDPVRHGAHLRSNTETARPQAEGADADVDVERWPSGKTLVGVLACYAACVVAASYPLIRTLGSTLPDTVFDPLQHLWIMRWYRACALEGRWPTFCPEIQYPVGAPLGNFSPLYLQSALFIPLSILVHNDVFAYNILWMAGFVFTGIGTFALIWQVLRSRACALFGGMLAMLSGPMVLHAKGHLELLYVGCFPLFLAAWMRFVDRPGRRRLAWAVGLFVLVGLCASYFLVFATVPAALYVLYQVLAAIRRRDGGWIKSRAGWLGGFAALALPAVAALFAPLLWSMARGYCLPRPGNEFEFNGAPLWTYVAPTKMHRLSTLLPFDAYKAAGIRELYFERGSYMGIVTLALVFYAAANVVRFPRARFWWITVLTLILLACGGHWRVGSHWVPLPGLWLRRFVLPFQMIRVPARFNLFIAVVLALLAAAGLRHLLARLGRRGWALAAYVGLFLAAMLDLAPMALARPTLPPVPAFYARLLQKNPQAAFLEIPQYQDGSSLDSYCGFFQSSHRGHTSAGYSGQSNAVFDDLLVWNSPFAADRLADPEYLRCPEDFLNPQRPGLHWLRPDVVRTLGEDAVHFREYAWLYTAVHGFDYIILHDLYQWNSAPVQSPSNGRLRELLRGAKLDIEDPGATVYECRLLQRPKCPVLLTTRGWRASARKGEPPRVAEKVAWLAVFTPEAARPYRLIVEAKALRKTRTVRLRSEGLEIARWSIPADHLETFQSPAFQLPSGIRVLELVSDAQESPWNRREAASDRDKAPYSLRVASIALESVSEIGESPIRHGQE
jgi:hypothetical protein